MLIHLLETKSKAEACKMAMPMMPPGSVMLMPEAGFCVKATRAYCVEAGGKVFINVCCHPRIDPAGWCRLTSA